VAATSPNVSGLLRPYLTFSTSPPLTVQSNFGVRPFEDLSSNLQVTESPVAKPSGPGGFSRKSASAIGVAGGSHTRARRSASARMRSRSPVAKTRSFPVRFAV
jgi:hypothetical protein